MQKGTHLTKLGYQPISSLFYKTIRTFTVSLYENEGYGGKEQELNQDSPDLTLNFPNGVNSVAINENAKWQVFTKVGYHGATVVLDPGRRYTSLDAMGLGNPVKSLRKFPVVMNGMVILYEDEGYGGKTQELKQDSPDFPDLSKFSGGIKSVILDENAKKWQLFTQVGYQGVSVILEPGRRYTSLDAMGLGSPVKSMREFSGENAYNADINNE